MKAFTYILLIFLCSQFLTSQEIREIWRKSDVHNVDYIYHDIATNLLYVLDRTNNGTVWMLNPETGEFVDSIHTSMISNYMTLSPNKKLLLLNGSVMTTIYDIEKKEVLSSFYSSGHAGFIDNNTILYYAPNDPNGFPVEMGIYKCDIYNNNIENLWNNLPYMGGHISPYSRADILLESCFNSDGKYALISLWSYSEGHDVILFDVENRTELNTYNSAKYPMFSPNGREFIMLLLYQTDYYNLFKLNDFNNSYRKFISSNKYCKFINDGSGVILSGANTSYFEFGENFDIHRQVNYKLGNILDYDIFNKGIYTEGTNLLVKLDFQDYLSIESINNNNNSNFDIKYDSIHSSIVIKNTNASAERVDINLYSIVGNLILSKNNVLINNTETINLSENATGIYILQITNNSTNLSFKIIKN